MVAVYGAGVSLTVLQTPLCTETFYISATLLQYPLGWLSDQMDRRLLVISTAFADGVGALSGYGFKDDFVFLLFAAD